MLIRDFTLSVGEFKDIPCTAPTSMYCALYENGLIPSPSYGLNELALTPLSEEDACFTAVFSVDAQTLLREWVELTFYGLDTICDIYLNGTHLGKTMNMHRSYTYEVKSLLLPEDNTLRLEFSSPIRYFKEMNDKHFLYTNSDSIQGAAHLRKALYMSGWDWGPTLPDMGIPRDILLRGYDVDRIDEVEIRQEHKKGTVRLKLDAKTKQGRDDCRLFATVDGKKTELPGDVTVEDPRLWWPRGYGEQNLYDVVFTLEKDGEVIDTLTKTVGLRTVTLSTGPANDYEFAFVVNGLKIFAMGANYIPQDNFPSLVTAERTEKLLLSACDANFNCIRVWGGGYYPEDFFYDLCDRLGLLVWQDFMSACISVWLRREVKEEIRAEAIENVKRLRHHPSLALLCGNNENESAIGSWGVVKRELDRLDYVELYERIFPEVVWEHAPDVFYWPASPSSIGGFKDTDDYTKGDSHYWDVWHGGAAITAFRKHSFRFCSEFGFEAFPSIKTVRAFCDEGSLNPFSRVMEGHQKCKNGNRKILSYLAGEYLYSLNTEDLVYASQLMQARAIKCGVEHFRRNRGYCMGSIYWQFNDCWPAVSWSSVDCYGRYKLLHYAARKFYAPVAMGLFLEKERLTVNVSNEQRDPFEGSIRIRQVDNRGCVLSEEMRSISLDPLSSEDVVTCKVKRENLYTELVIVDLLNTDGTLLQRQSEMFTKPKFFEWQKPTFTVDAKDTAEGVVLTVTSDLLAKDVMIDFECENAVLSDNGFDLIGGEAYTLLAKTALSADALKKQILIKSVYDIGR